VKAPEHRQPQIVQARQTRLHGLRNLAMTAFHAES